MFTRRSILLTIALLACCQCFWKETAASFSMNHPQKTFCDADYVFRFRPMTMPEEPQSAPSEINRVSRSRRLAPGGPRMPKTQMVEVERIFKGEKMMMKVPIMKMASAKNPSDTFSSERRMEATIRLGMYQKALDTNQDYVFFGRMYRYRNNTMRPSSQQIMLSTMVNTIPESSLTKVMRRGLRKKYARGCKSGCQVRTVYYSVTRKSREYCYWNVNAYPVHKIDCCKTSQICFKGRDGFCHWKRTKAYRACVAKNRMP